MLELKPEGFHLADAHSEPLAVCGRQLIADNSGALFWPSQSTLLVADLQLGDGTTPQGNGSGDPGRLAPSAARRTLVRLAEVMDRYEPARVIALGDGVVAGVVDSAGRGAAGLAAEEMEILRILQEDREWIWLTGHDHGSVAPRLGGSACGDVEISGIRLRHRPAPRWTTHEIGAFLRPVAHLSIYGYSLRRACFVGNGRRLVMPAFGAAADGRNVLDEAFRPLFGSGGMAVWLLGHGGLYPVAARFLASD
jgi:metallophosphoesterase superfamily enzyme